jgi:hypothetical protein
MTIPTGDTRNYDTLMKAIKGNPGRICLMQVRRRADQKEVSAIAILNRDDDGLISFTPFAIMVEGNPFELFDPPNPDDGYWAPTMT